MGKDDRIEALLIEWAQWLTVGDGSGYATMSVLHVDWSPPAPGATPSLKVYRPQRAAQLHAQILQLSQRLQDTLAVHYVMRLPVAEQARRLECAESTVHSRVQFAKRMLTQENVRSFDCVRRAQ